MEGEQTQHQSSMKKDWTLIAGFLLGGIAIAVTTFSYVSNMTFSPQWLVWVVGAAFAVVALLFLVWPRFVHQKGTPPKGNLRMVFVLSIPVAFLVSSQVCGLGLRACNSMCHITNISLIILGGVTAFQLYRGKAATPILIPMIVFALIPHCVCHAPINTTWHGMLGGIAPTCEMIPLGASLFAVAGLRGIRPGYSAALVGMLFGVMAFIIVGGLLFGFPWQGCIDHPMG